MFLDPDLSLPLVEAKALESLSLPLYPEFSVCPELSLFRVCSSCSLSAPLLLVTILSFKTLKLC